MVFGRERLQKMLSHAILAHKECGHAAIVASDQRVSLLASEAFKGSEARSVVVGRVVPNRGGIVRNRTGRCVFQARVIFNCHDARPKRGNRTPDPIVVSVDVDTQEVKFGRNVQFTEKGFDVFHRDEAVLHSKSLLIEKERAVFEDLLVTFGAAVDPCTRPTLQKQIGGAVFKSITYAEFNKKEVCGSDAVEDFLNDAV